jgi:tetratricopeptide (TPR) repeat protein
MSATWTNIAEVLIKQGRLDEATGYVERSLRWVEGALGPRHPDLMINLDQLGSILERQGKPEEALRHYERELAIAESTYGPDQPDVLPSLDAMTRISMEQGRLDEARRHAERSAEIARATFGSESSIFAEILGTLGSVLQEQGKLDEALERYRRGLSIAEAADPKGHRVARFLSDIGEIQRRQGRLDEALASFRRASTLAESTLGPEHPDVVRAVLGLAEVELERREPETARTHAELAVTMLEAGKIDVTPNRQPLELAWARFLLAQALWPETEERPRAHALAEQARDALVGSKRRLDVEHSESVQAWLARHPAP